MSKKFDYSKYKFEDWEKYSINRKDSKDITFSYFHNKVICSDNKKEFTIIVDNYHEFSNMEGLEEKVSGKTKQEYIQTEEDIENHNSVVQKNRKIISYFSKLFNIKLMDEEEGLINSFSGAHITVPLGEGILNYCYSDFSKSIHTSEQLFHMTTPEFAEKYYSEKFKTLSEPTPEEIKNHGEEILALFDLYTFTESFVSEIMNVSLYSAIFPPVFLTKDIKGFKRYALYIKILQKEFLELLQFCFDEEFYPKVLGGLYPSERYILYCTIKNRKSIFSRTENFSISLQHMSGESMPFGMDIEEIKNRLSTKNDLTDEHIEFFEKYDVDDDNKTHFEYSIPRFISVYYDCHNLYDMLCLEFTKLLESNVKFRKCKRCGRYFIAKGNYKADYCDRIIDDETQSCQVLAANEKYKNKISENSAWGAYNKYYKRYFARAKVGTIKKSVFKKWQYEATLKRDMCIDGSILLDEYLFWLDESFPNRKKK